MFIKNKGNKGITLIALVVTIIVLLILAGVSIQMLVGEGGILTNAKDASSETKKATAKENIDLEIADAILEDKELTAEGLNKHLKEHIPGLTHGGQSLEENPITELPTNVELDGFMFEIDEYGKTSEVNGIILSKNSLNLQIEVSGSNKEYGEETITATLVGISGDITWSTEKTGIIGVEPLDGGTSAKITAKKAGTEKVTTTCSGKTAECSVTVEEVQSPYIDSSYVNYDIAYTDVYTETPYTSKTGWRLLTKIEDEKDKYNETEGTYTGDIEIISTGIPAILYYDYNSIDTAPWAGKDSQRQQFVDEYNYGWKDNYNVYASAGLLYNFKQIVFNFKGDDLNTSTIEKNRGGFVNIVTNGKEATEGEKKTGDSLFTANIASGTIDEIRSVSLEDLTGKKDNSTSIRNVRIGLFTLEDYTPDVHNSGSYWLAYPRYRSCGRSLFQFFLEGRPRP